MTTLPYRHAFERIRAEFFEMPGLHLIPEEVERLSGVESGVCKAVLDDLVRAGFLCISSNGRYCRSLQTSISRTRPRREESEEMQRPPVEGSAR